MAGGGVDLPWVREVAQDRLNHQHEPPGAQRSAVEVHARARRDRGGVQELGRHRLVSLALRQSKLDETWQDILDAGSAVAYSTNSSLAEIAAVHSGLGVGLLPVYAARLFSLVRVLPVQQWRRRDIWLVVHPDVKSSVRIRVLFDAVAQTFKRYGHELQDVQDQDFSI